MKIDPLAELILSELARRPGGGQVVLGGYFALQRYIDYRTTHDIDAWWKSRADPLAEAEIRAAMQKVAADQGLSLNERRFGETISFELSRGSSKVFSFQIAIRSVELEPPQASDWPPILIETLNDTVASKMNALVNRGSPRDYTDIYQIVRSGHMKIDQCWSLWKRKNHDGSLESAKQKVLLHLAGLEQRRPLARITDENERQKATTIRGWFHDEFCRP